MTTVTEGLVRTLAVVVLCDPGGVAPVRAEFSSVGELPWVSAEILPVVRVDTLTFVVRACQRTHDRLVAVDLEVLVSGLGVQ